MYDAPWHIEVIPKEYQRPYVVVHEKGEDCFLTSDYRRAEHVRDSLNLLASYEEGAPSDP